MAGTGFSLTRSHPPGLVKLHSCVLGTHPHLQSLPGAQASEEGGPERKCRQRGREAQEEEVGSLVAKGSGERHPSLGCPQTWGCSCCSWSRWLGLAEDVSAVSVRTVWLPRPSEPGMQPETSQPRTACRGSSPCLPAVPTLCPLPACLPPSFPAYLLSPLFFFCPGENPLPEVYTCPHSPTAYQSLAEETRSWVGWR